MKDLNTQPAYFILNFKSDIRYFKSKIKFSKLITYVIITTFLSISIKNEVVAQNGCLTCASLATYPQLASVNTNDGALTELILGSLLGTSVNLTALNWQGLAQGDVAVLEMLEILQAQLGLSSPEAVLNANLTLAQILNAAATAASNSGTAAALNAFAVSVPSGTVQLANILSANLINGSLADFDINAFTLVTGLVQLYNYENVATTPTPIAANIPLVGNVTVYAQVVEPPHFGCINEGDGFFSAGVRLLLQVSLLNQSAIQTNINILNVASVNSSTTLTNVSIYIDVARGDVSVDEVNSSGNTVDLSVQPGLARAAIGTIPINNFFNRAQDPFASLDFATIGNINVDVDFLLLPDVNVNLGLQVKGLGDASPGVLAITRGVPFGPETIGSSSTVIATLLNDLTVNSTYQLTPNSLGAVILNPLIVALKNSVGTVLFANNTGIVYNILANVADPLLNATGIGIGQVIIGSAGIAEVCFDFDDTPNIYNTLMSSGGPFHQITPNLYLGTQMPNADADGMPGVMGQPADNDGPDDGLVASYGVVSGNNYSLTVVATNNTGMDALLVAWIDFDGNGSFEANESSQVIVGQGTNQSIPLSWIIADTVVASSYIRARISTDPVFVNNPSTVGFCTDGEVEGELITFAILPVTLLKFDGQKLPDHNMLTWIVENEENFYGFQIERSKDAAIFTSVGFIPSSKNQRSGRKIYTFTDADGSQSNYYYRLKMVDLDEKFTYSKIIYLDGSKATGFDFYPNPASNQVRIDINGTDQKDVLVEIFDFSGKMVLRNKFTNFDDNLIDLDIDLLDQGMYILSITHGTSQAIHKKLLIQK